MGTMELEISSSNAKRDEDRKGIITLNCNWYL
jgi:hypothetical protein